MTICFLIATELTIAPITGFIVEMLQKFLNALFGLMVKFDYAFKNWLLKKAGIILFKPISKLRQLSQMPQKILIFRTGSIGDSICAMPALSAIRNYFPEAQIDILTSSGNNVFVQLSHLIDRTKFNRIINYFGMNKKELFRELKREGYDLFIELPQYDATLKSQLRNMLIVRLLGIRSAFGWKISSSFFLKKYQEQHTAFLREKDRLLEILKSHGVEIKDPKYIVGIDQKNRDSVEQILKKLNLLSKKNNLGLVVGGKLERNKWPLKNCQELINHFLKKGFKILIFGGPEDKNRAESLISNKSDVFNFCGEFSPLETGLAMQSCAAVVSNDTGPMHLAYVMNVPLIALFASRDYPIKWYPPKSEFNRVFRSSDISCSMCTVQVPCPDNFCLGKISATEVIQAVEEILKKLS